MLFTVIEAKSTAASPVDVPAGTWKELRNSTSGSSLIASQLMVSCYDGTNNYDVITTFKTDWMIISYFLRE